MTALVALALASGAFAAEHPGRRVFDAAGCGACHRIEGRGGNAGPDLSWVGFRRSPEWLRVWLRAPRAWKPDTKMPDFRLEGGDLEALVGYLATLKPGPAGTRGGVVSAESGRLLYNRAGCVACHGPAGRGGHPNNNVQGGLIPALAELAGTYTEDELVTRIGSGKRSDKLDPAGPEPLVRMPAWNQALNTQELRSLALYVKSLAAPTAANDW